MDDVDHLLAELKAKYDQQLQASSPPDSYTSEVSANQAMQPMLSLDDLLSHLEDGTKRSVRKALSQQSTRTHQPVLTRSEAMSPIPAPPVDPILNQLRSHYAAQDQVEQQKQEQERQAVEARRQKALLDKQRRLEVLRAKRRAELADQATVWLKTLKPRSEEGLWFEEFACNYDSRLEAAVDYLEALQAVERESPGV